MENIEVIKILNIFKEELFNFYKDLDRLNFRKNIQMINFFISEMCIMTTKNKIYPENKILPKNHDVIDSFFKASNSLIDSFNTRHILAYDHSKEGKNQKAKSMKQAYKDLSSFESFLKKRLKNF